MMEPGEALALAVAALKLYRLDFVTEERLQSQMHSALRLHLLAADWVREHRVEGGRLDHYSRAWSVAIEAKVSGTFAQVLSQVSGYLQLEEVRGLLIVSRRHVIRELPVRLHDKPLRTYWLGAQGL